MITIYNKSESTKIFKALDLPNLRVYPGSNTIESEELFNKYLIDNEVAQAIVEKCFDIKKTLSSEDILQAKKAKEKNDMLNKSQRPPKKLEKRSVFDTPVKEK